MNWDTIEGKWNQMKGDIKSKWSKLTDDDITMISAKRDKLIGKLQERYGIMKDDAEQQVDTWLKGMNQPRQTY